jgi:glycosyltransferase involved in cell wall biosynthesis
MKSFQSQEPKVAFVHDWLTTFGGGEVVLQALLEIWPEAPVYTLVFDPNGPCKEIILHRDIVGSFIQKLPKSKSKHQLFLPFMPLAVEQFDLSDYDIILSSSHAVAKGVLTKGTQLHISYVHSPIRYAWDLQFQYLREAGLEKGLKSAFARMLLHYIRLWDLRTVNGVNYFIANSKFIAKRIQKVYNRSSTVIYPPIDTEIFSIKYDKGDYYLAISRFVPYKKMAEIVNAFTQLPDKKLVVVGDGPEREKIYKLATNNIELLGFQSRDQIVNLLQNAKAFVFMAEEDFGILPVEAQACGTPVIAFGKGGVLETVVDGKTGLFFDEQTVASLIEAIKRFEEIQSIFEPEILRKNAERFSKERFQTEIRTFVEKKWEEFRTL